MIWNLVWNFNKKIPLFWVEGAWKEPVESMESFWDENAFDANFIVVDESGATKFSEEF